MGPTPPGSLWGLNELTHTTGPSLSRLLLNGRSLTTAVLVESPEEKCSCGLGVSRATDFLHLPSLPSSPGSEQTMCRNAGCLQPRVPTPSTALTFLSQMPCLGQCHPLALLHSCKTKPKTDLGGKEGFNEWNCLQPHFLLRKKRLRFWPGRGKPNCFASPQLPGSARCGVEQKLRTQHRVSEPGASLAGFSLAGDTQLKQVSSPAVGVCKALCSTCPRHRRGGPARPWQSTDHPDKGSERGRRQLEMGCIYLASGQGDQDIQGPALSSPPNEGQCGIKRRPRTCCSNKSLEDLQPLSLLQRVALDGIEGPDSRRALSL